MNIIFSKLQGNSWSFSFGKITMTNLYQAELKYQYMDKLCIWILKFDNMYNEYRFLVAIDFPLNINIARYVHINLDVYNFLVNNNICESLKIRHCQDDMHILCDLKLTPSFLLQIL
jgi:TRAP-type mannitol/chloroaromatic compound transport system permease large subunit